MKTVGIIGGLGPDTTAQFYLQLIELAKSLDPNDRPPVIIWSTAMDLEREKSFIAGNDESELYVRLLTAAAKKLESAGADFIVIPCNSVHIFIEKIRDAVQIPVLSIVEETVNFLRTNNLNRIGLMATSATRKNRLYAEALEKSGIKITEPSEENQILLDEIIIRLVNNEDSKPDQERAVAMVDLLAEQNVQAVVLACTDLQLIIPSHPKVAVYDSMKILVESTARKIFAPTSPAGLRAPERE